MHVSTPLRKVVAVQTHLASVAAQPVLPMALRAQVTAHGGKVDRSCEAARRSREEKPTAARVSKRILSGWLSWQPLEGVCCQEDEFAAERNECRAAIYG